MRLEKLQRPFVTTNDLYVLSEVSEPAIVKVYRGLGAAERCSSEAGRLKLWRDAGFGVPGLLDYQIDELESPYIVMQHLQGPSLREVLLDGSVELQAKLDCWQRVVEELAGRHRRAISDNEIEFVHGDSNTGNVIITADAIRFLDLESSSKFSNVVEAASVEMSTLCRWAVRDIGPARCDVMMRLVLEAYQDMTDVVVYVTKRTLVRPFQWFHRWRDSVKRSRRVGEVTKYDIADSIVRLTGR